MSDFEKMASNFGAFATSPVGLGLGATFFLTLFTIVLLIKKMNQKISVRKRKRLGGEIVSEISAALRDATIKNPSMRVRTINNDLKKMVAVDCITQHPSKGYRVLEIEVRPHLDMPITIRQGPAYQQVNKLAPGQLSALCEAVRNYNPVEVSK